MATMQPGVPVQPRRPWLFYGYIVVAAAFVIQMMTWGIYNSYGVFFNAMLGEFGWARATLSGAAALSQFLVGVGAVFLGRLNRIYGSKPKAPAGTDHAYHDKYGFILD